MRKLFTILFHPFFILCKNIFVLVETTTNPEVIDDIIKVLPLSKINDDCKNSLIKNRAPEKSFKFPPKIYKDSRKKSGETRRYCLHELFDNFKFLSYSKSTDGLFCLACVLFPTSAHQGSRAKILITQPYRNWKDTREDLKNHSVLEYHKDSLEKMNSFLSCFKNPTILIDQSITQTSAAVVSRNRQCIASILRAVEYCGRQGIALRGHRDDGPLFDEASSNRGNFKELIMLRSEFDKNLKDSIESCVRYATYLSKTTQNDLLSCIKDFIQSEMVNDIQNQTEAPFYGTSADKVIDVSNWEQVGTVVRYVRNCQAIEKTIRICAV